MRAEGAQTHHWKAKAIRRHAVLHCHHHLHLVEAASGAKGHAWKCAVDAIEPHCAREHARLLLLIICSALLIIDVLHILTIAILRVRVRLRRAACWLLLFLPNS